MRRVAYPAALVALACLGRGDEVVKPAANARPPTKTQGKRAGCSVAASIPYWDQDSAAASLRAHVDLINTVSLFWFHLTPAGEIETYARARTRRSLVRFARENGVQVLGLVANLPDDEREGGGLTWDPDRVASVLRPRAARARHIRALVELTRRWELDGIHIDYEALPAKDRDDFTRLVAELAGALHASGKVLAVAAHDKTATRVSDNGAQAQDWRALIDHVDQLQLMTYNQHSAGTGPGPVASLRWVEPILRHAVNLDLPADKIFAGLPLYAEAWHRDGDEPFSGIDEDLTFRDVQRQLRKNRGETSWSEEHASPRATFREPPDHQHVLWFENARSSERKLELISRLGLCNVALWRLGGEDPALWPVLRRHLGRGGGDR